MATAEDESSLRAHWSEHNLREFEGQWIAFRNNEVIERSPSLQELSEQFYEEILTGTGPLFAYVTFKVRA